MISDDNTFKYYLEDLARILKEKALESVAEKRRAAERKDEDRGAYDYWIGHSMALNHVISIMQQQAKGFDIPLEILHLHDIEPDRDLL